MTGSSSTTEESVLRLTRRLEKDKFKAYVASEDFSCVLNIEANLEDRSVQPRTSCLAS